MIEYLGDDWAFLMTDVTAGSAGNHERLAFVYQTSRLQPSGLACEIVLKPHDDEEPVAPSKQFARTPYAVSFKAGEQTFILLTVRIHYGDHATERTHELKAIAQWMDKWAKKSNRFHQNLIVLGDFNIDRHEDPLWQAFTSTGLYVPPELNNVKRSIFVKEGQDPMRQKFYDQIAWFQTGAKKARLTMKYVTSGGFDFLPYIYRDTTISKVAKSHRMSDHYPLWTEFKRT
jgi:exonuclease III